MSITTLRSMSQSTEPVHAHQKKVTSYVSNWAVITGRVLFSLIFILSSLHHFSAGTVNMAQDQGVPMANLLVPLSGFLALAGGLSILFAYKEKIGAALLMVFLIPVTVMMHNFWAVSDPNLVQMQMANFMKNLALFGALVLIYQYAPALSKRKATGSLNVVGI